MNECLFYKRKSMLFLLTLHNFYITHLHHNLCLITLQYEMYTDLFA